MTVNLISSEAIIPYMRKTLVLVVDRDDDFGVKGKVNTPVVGVQNCLDAATAFGIADPEDSDLNALYAAVSVCLEIQEDGHDADVALICGDEKVGHRSDLALVAQLEEVLDEVEPDSVVLVGDGAEDEYIYPIISSRAHVDSVRKVYVKQAPGLEGSLYIMTKMLSDPAKRKRFLVPLGFIIVLLSLFFIMPALLVYSKEHDINVIAGMSGSLTVCFIGILLLLYGYNMGERFDRFQKKLKSSITDGSTRLIFLSVSIALVLICAIWNYLDIKNYYNATVAGSALRYISAMIWPVVIGFEIYLAGVVIHNYQTTKAVKLSLMFDMVAISSLGMVGLGILDTILGFVETEMTMNLGIVEIVLGILMSIMSNFIKGRLLARDSSTEAEHEIS